MLGAEAEVVAYDLHPEYLATKWALEQDAELIAVQHHHAHAAACLAEHGEHGPALSLVFDGTGYGTDGTLWGEAAIREPWRTAASYLERAGRLVPFERWPVVRETLKVNAPLSSGMGRLFDAVAALLGIREEITY